MALENPFVENSQNQTAWGIAESQRNSTLVIYPS